MILNSNYPTLEAGGDPWLEEFDNFLLKNLSDPSLTIDWIAFHLTMSRRTLFRTVKKLTGLSPNLYIRQMRLEKGYDMLNSGLFHSVKQIALKVGFKKVDYFSQIFKEKYGVCPVEILRHS